MAFEFLAGRASDWESPIRLEAPSYAVHEEAATLARRFRLRGNTSSTVDTLIVQMAVHHGVMLLTRDRMQADLVNHFIHTMT